MKPRTHWAEAVVLRVLELCAAGLSDAAVAERTGVPRATVRNYRRGRVPRRALALEPEVGCPSCGGPVHDFHRLPAAAYVYLLGAYLGDGTIGRSWGSHQLRVAMDVGYPGILEEVARAIQQVRGREPLRMPAYDARACLYLVSNWKQWPCLFPQHGPGRKHLRPIVLAPWQQELVHAQPEHLLRGLIHTDGWRGLNTVRVNGREYAYPRYQFSNRSDDIRRLFTDTCDALGIAWRPWGRWHISVARREAVARMDQFIGPKR